MLDNLRTTRETPGGRNHRHEYAADGRLTRIVDPAAPSTAVIGYTYDARGNATSRSSATGFVPNATAIVVDDANRVRSATVGADTETFTYDGLGRRTRTTTGFGTLVHFYSQAGQLLLWETPGNEVKTRQYTIYLGDRQIAHRLSSGPVYVHTDHLGSVLAKTSPIPVTLTFGSPHWEPWGAPVGGVFWGGLQYAGHYQDRTTALTYMQQRYYDPYAGRFLAVDPVASNPISFNRYWYANNNPYKYIDPDGRWTCSSTGKQCEDFEKGLEIVREASQSSRLNGSERKALAAVVSAFGDKGDDSVRISFEETKGRDGGSAQYLTDGGSGKKYTDIKISTNNISGGGDYAARLSGVIAHEGQHAADDIARERPIGSRSERMQTEINSYTSEVILNKGINYIGSGKLWTPAHGIKENGIRGAATSSVNSSCASAPQSASCN